MMPIEEKKIILEKWSVIRRVSRDDSLHWIARNKEALKEGINKDNPIYDYVSLMSVSDSLEDFKWAKMKIRKVVKQLYRKQFFQYKLFFEDYERE